MATIEAMILVTKKTSNMHPIIFPSDLPLAVRAIADETLKKTNGTITVNITFKKTSPSGFKYSASCPK